MRRIVKTLALAAGVAGPLAGCVTQKKVDEAIAVERQRTDERFAEEAQAREEGDQRLQGQLEAQQAEIRQLEQRFDAEVTVFQDRIRFAMPVTFAFDSDAVEDTAPLDRFAQVVQEYYPDKALTVQGYADPAGQPKYNADLSQRRAEAVRGYLVSQGIDGERIRAIGFGEEFQVVPGAAGDDPGGETNRRVVFVVEGVQAAAEEIAS